MLSAPFVLLAEDEPIIALEIQRILEENGFHVVLAVDLRQILDVCARHRPRLVMLNFQLAGYPDGMAVARLLRQRFGLRVVLVTGAPARHLAASYHFDAGVDVLYKPFTRAQLRGGIDRWLSA